MRQAIKLKGSLTCPSPASDKAGSYRVGVDKNGVPQIQRQDAQGAWQPV
jgi:hypothetical protein